MSTASKAAEAAKTAALFHAALVALGVRVAIEALQLWQDVATSPARLPQTAEKWLGQATNLTMFRRRHARDLAFSYYRLTRALRTGYTIQPLDEDEATEEVPLDTLRTDFYEKVQELTPDVLEQEDFDTEEFLDGGDEQAEVEELARLREEEEQAERDAEEEARIVLEALGPNNLNKRLKLIDTEEPASKVDQDREDAHRAAGARQASASARVAMNGGRQGLQRLGDKDARAIGWVRLGRTGTPCGWCALFISRGATYKSKKSAQGARLAPGAKPNDGRLFHDNCNCYVEQIFTDAQYEESTYDLNREYEALWPAVTRGLEGKEALAAWRRHFRNQKS